MLLVSHALTDLFFSRGTYVLYGVIGIVMLIWLVLFAPEPKGLALEEIEVIFRGPLVVTKLNYDEYIQNHRDEVERIRAEINAKHLVHDDKKEEIDEKEFDSTH